MTHTNYVTEYNQDFRYKLNGEYIDRVANPPDPGFRHKRRKARPMPRTGRRCPTCRTTKSATGECFCSD